MNHRSGVPKTNFSLDADGEFPTDGENVTGEKHVTGNQNTETNIGRSNRETIEKTNKISGD